MIDVPSPVPSARAGPREWRSKRQCAEAIRTAGRDELARMRREDHGGATSISSRPQASAGWGLNLLLPAIAPALPWETAKSDQVTVPDSRSHPKTLASSASHAQISVDVPPSPDKSAPQSPPYGTAMSSMYGSATARSTAAGSVRNGVSGLTSSRQAAKDRFKANLARLEKVKSQDQL